ncbi:MAG: heavy metal translocating P-type ATPase metal-binding domain-containing protein, partial [Burkholderiaceae bacterium]|nr:heavy metal translocating P-type ATPase metal-binding domain-containing protein [Burkholderiaceae bacterium]
MQAESAPGAGNCYHCALPLEPGANWFTEIGGERRPMCCAGCQAVAQAIVDAGLEDYYRHRSAPASGPETVAPLPAELAIYDTPEVQQGFVRAHGELAEATLMLEGLRCGACVWVLERALAGEPGVHRVAVNFATERAVLRWDPARTRISRLLERIAQVGYRARPFDVRAREAQIARTSRALSRRMFVAGIGMMQVMMYALPAYTAAPGEIEWRDELLMRWASFVLTIPVLLYSAQPFFGGALRDLRARNLGMDVPVALGIGAAFAASAWATVTGRGEVYFDSVTMFVFLLLGARHLEWVARRRASRAVDALAASAPEHATRLTAIPDPPTEAALAAAGAETVPAARIAIGDVLRVGVGERVAVDAIVLAGSTAIDQSLLTGESAPVSRARGDEVAGGSINAGSPVHLRALRTSGESTPSMIERLIERAALERPAAALLADRVASGFVLLLLVFALAVFAIWWSIDPARALPIAVTVLVVSCPCALSLATPAAIAASTGAVTRAGILVTSGRAFETIARCTDVVFDKTGTLTEGRPRIVAVEPFGAIGRDRALELAAALEAGASHPIAAALREAARAAAAEAGPRYAAQ